MNRAKFFFAFLIISSPVWPDSLPALTPGQGNSELGREVQGFKQPLITIPRIISTPSSAFPGRNSSAPPLMVPTSVPNRISKKDRILKSSETTMEDYFPVVPGSKVNYEYLAPAPGERVKKTRVVECQEYRRMGDGTLVGKFKISDGFLDTAEYQDILFTLEGAQNFTGKKPSGRSCFLKLPKKGRRVKWKYKLKGGIVQSFQAGFDKTRIKSRNYPDCLCVSEKEFKKGRLISTQRDYYSKGIGLILRGFYGPKGKLVRSKSFAYLKMEGSGKPVPFSLKQK